MSRQCRGEAVPSQAHAYQRWPLAPVPAERTSQPRRAASSVAAACLQVSRTPRAAVRQKSDGTRSTYARPRASRYSRSQARRNSYRVKRPGDHGTRHSGPATIKLVNPGPARTPSMISLCWAAVVLGAVRSRAAGR